MPKIFISRAMPVSARQLLQDAFGEEALSTYSEDHVIPREILLRSVAGIDGLFVPSTEKINAELFDAAGPGLKIVANWAVGCDNIDIQEATQRGIVITNTPGVLTEATADLAWALLLAAARRTGEAERYLRAGQWKEWSPRLLLGVELSGKTLGIFGFGQIGKAVARRARGFGMKILYHSRTRLSDAEEQTLNTTFVDKDTLLAESDFLSLHCPLLPETRNAFTASEFAAMKPTAVFINTTRGAVVDEGALAHALKDGHIFAAGLDVFVDGLSVHPELLACENAVLLPHIGSGTEETRTNMAKMAVTNIIDFFTGETPQTCVNPEVL